MTKWVVAPRPTIEHPAQNDLERIVQELLVLRGIVTEEDRDTFFGTNYEDGLHDPELFVEMPAVRARIAKAKRDEEQVIVFGDFDVDGVTGSTLLKEAFDRLEIHATVYIPHKETEGHGLNMKACESFVKSGATLLLTVDCGITNTDEIAYLQENGVDVIVIDHHHIPEVLPPAHAVINAQMEESGYPFRSLCGAGTAFKVIQSLYKELLPGSEQETKWMLDLVATGTVADCMPIVGENRTLVKYGLIVIAKTRRVGLQELIRVGRIPIDESRPPTTTTIGFHIGPRINAAGRMAHAKEAHLLLMERDRVRAREMAEYIDKQNQERRKITEKFTKEVLSHAKKHQQDDSLIFAVHEDYPIGIVGLIAGRIANDLGRPAGVFTKGDTTSTGSFRTPAGVHIADMLASCDDILLKHGGHAQAGGATVQNEHLDVLQTRLNVFVKEQLHGVIPEVELKIDRELPAGFVTLSLVDMLKKFEPFGEGNREPLFLIKNLLVQSLRYVGSTEKHVKMGLGTNDDSHLLLDAIGFNLKEKCTGIEESDRVNVVATVEDNIWNGSRSVQLKLVDVQKV